MDILRTHGDPRNGCANFFEKYSKSFGFQEKHSFFKEEILFRPLADILLWVKIWVRMVFPYFSSFES